MVPEDITFEMSAVSGWNPGPMMGVNKSTDLTVRTG